MKSFVACLLLVAFTVAEPPVDSRYLPPQQGGGFSTPSSTYGAPSNGHGAHAKQTTAILGRQSARRPSSQYGAPSPQYGAPSAGFGAPSSQYGAPALNTPSAFSAPSSQYGAPSAHSAPSSQYGAPPAQSAPSSQYGAPSAHNNGPSSQYGAPSAHSAPSSQYGAPSALSAPSSQYGAPSADREYLPPGGASGYGDEGHNEPANYSFEYMVKDEPSGNDFGHRESRQGDRAEGLYYVLLPDGRKQTVQYEADQAGYRPRISYEDVGLGGYPAAGYGGQGGPY